MRLASFAFARPTALPRPRPRQKRGSSPRPSRTCRIGSAPRSTALRSGNQLRPKSPGGSFGEVGAESDLSDNLLLAPPREHVAHEQGCLKALRAGPFPNEWL